jgi:putative polyketide hydroxylase
MPDETTQVLIVGGSLVGLSTALFLRRHGVDTVLVERHHGTSIHPRTPGYNARTMELFRAAGVEEAVRAAGPWRLTGTGLLWAETLTSENHRWLAPPSMRGPQEEFSDVSPSNAAVLAQDKLEPVLREHAERLGADLRFGTELVSFTHDADGVTTVVANRETGAQRTVRAQYVVAADGADSPVRTQLGIERDGLGVLEYMVGIMVRADLREALRDKSFAVCQVANSDVSAMVRVVGDLVSLNVNYRPDVGETVGQFTKQRCVELTRAAAGIPDLPVEPIDVRPWQPTAAVAQRFADGRVFLVGDAAHVMPPSGALGANTGIQDGWNLAWKLAFVLHGWAGTALLDTYEAERRPVAELTVAQALARGREWFGANSPAEVAAIELIDDTTLMFGYCYPSAAPTDTIEPFENPAHPTGRPGTRIAHAWLDRSGQRVSTVDLWASGLVLLAGPEGDAWPRVAHEITERCGVPITAHRATRIESPTDTPNPLDPERWARVSGTTSTGALLIRPDGFIAWRTEEMPDQPAVTLDGALRHLLATSSRQAVP